MRCIEALMVRDLMMRYGRGNIGFLWVLLEPMLLTVGVMTLWSLTKGSTEHGLNLVAFVVSGYMPLTMWRHITNLGASALRRNSSIFFHRRISAIDCVISIAVLEFAGTTAAFVVVVATMLTLGLIEPIQDWTAVVNGWLMMAYLSFSAMIIICALTEMSEVWERFIQPFQYLMLPISGSIFMVDWFPSNVHEIAWYSPTVHIYEMIRAGFFGDNVVTHSDPWYPIAVATVLLAGGIWMLERARERSSFR